MWPQTRPVWSPCVGVGNVQAARGRILARAAVRARPYDSGTVQDQSARSEDRNGRTCREGPMRRTRPMPPEATARPTAASRPIEAFADAILSARFTSTPAVGTLGTNSRPGRTSSVRNRVRKVADLRAAAVAIKRAPPSCVVAGRRAIQRRTVYDTIRVAVTQTALRPRFPCSKRLPSLLSRRKFPVPAQIIPCFCETGWSRSSPKPGTKGGSGEVRREAAAPARACSFPAAPTRPPRRAACSSRRSGSDAADGNLPIVPRVDTKRRRRGDRDDRTAAWVRRGRRQPRYQASQGFVAPFWTRAAVAFDAPHLTARR